MSAANHHRVATRRRAIALAALIVLSTACSSGGDDDDDDARSGDKGSSDNGGQESTTTEAPTTTQAPGADTAAVQPHIEALLARYDTVVNELIADPVIASDSSSPQVEEYLSLFAPDAEFPQTALEGLADGAEADGTIEPTFPGEPISVTRLTGPIETVSDDEVSFNKCARFRYTERDAIGDVREQVHIDLRGDGIARRIDGVWRLEVLTTVEDPPGCPTESEAA